MDIENIVLIRGEGNREANQLCVMSLAALIAGEPHTDHPVCACPVLTSVAIRLNDGAWWDSDEQRTAALTPLAHKMVGTRSTPEVERARAHRFVVLAFSVFAPRALEIAADAHPSPEHAAKLRAHAVTLREAAVKLAAGPSNYLKERHAANNAANNAACSANNAACSANNAACSANNAACSANNAACSACAACAACSAYDAANAAAHAAHAAHAAARVADEMRNEMRDTLLNALLEAIDV